MRSNGGKSVSLAMSMCSCVSSLRLLVKRVPHGAAELPDCECSRVLKHYFWLAEMRRYESQYHTGNREIIWTWLWLVWSGYLCFSADVGFVIPNRFVVGYALDYNEYFRDLNVRSRLFLQKIKTTTKTITDKLKRTTRLDIYRGTQPDTGEHNQKPCKHN